MYEAMIYSSLNNVAVQLERIANALETLTKERK